MAGDHAMTVAEPALITAENLCVAQGDAIIVDGVDIAVRRGEIVTLIGPNGAGKSTLAKALLGLLPPLSGRIVRAPGLAVGYVPQRFAPDPVLPLSVRRLMTLTRRAGEGEIVAALAETGVAHLVGRDAHDLSGGELQRVLLARCLLGNPDLLILDEPVQGVDFAGETALYGLIGDVRQRRNCGILLISHDLHVVMAAADRVVCFNRHVCCHGPPESVARHPEYERLFGRAAAAGLAVYRHHHDHVHDVSGAVKPVADADADANANRQT